MPNGHNPNNPPPNPSPGPGTPATPGQDSGGATPDGGSNIPPQVLIAAAVGGAIGGVVGALIGSGIHP